MRKILMPCYCSIFLASCISTAKLSDFSQSSTTIDFDKYATESQVAKTPFWTSKTSNEYYFEKNGSVNDQKLIDAINKSLKAYNYFICASNTTDKCIIGKRGMMANEWNSITAVYYKVKENKIQVYIRTKITQDITGGWKENRAMKVGQLIEKNI